MLENVRERIDQEKNSLRELKSIPKEETVHE
jgi:hypothetical protein